MDGVDRAPQLATLRAQEPGDGAQGVPGARESQEGMREDSRGEAK